jgi:Animal haem peroxidase
LQFVQLRDLQGNAVDVSGPDAQQVAVSGIRRSTLAARLAAIYGTVDKVDAFVGMVSEQHVAKSDLGPLQMAMWKDQFTRLRDGDRLFYQVDPMLAIARLLGVTYTHPLSDIIRANTGAVTARDVFHAPL